MHSLCFIDDPLPGLELNLWVNALLQVPTFRIRQFRVSLSHHESANSRRICIRIVVLLAAKYIRQKLLNFALISDSRLPVRVEASLDLNHHNLVEGCRRPGSEGEQEVHKPARLRIYGRVICHVE